MQLILVPDPGVKRSGDSIAHESPLICEPRQQVLQTRWVTWMVTAQRSQGTPSSQSWRISRCFHPWPAPCPRYLRLPWAVAATIMKTSSSGPHRATHTLRFCCVSSSRAFNSRNTRRAAAFGTIPLPCASEIAPCRVCKPSARCFQESLLPLSYGMLAGGRSDTNSNTYVQQLKHPLCNR